MSFERVKAAGWALYEVLTSTQMNALDLNLSLATSSEFVPDYQPFMNFGPSITTDIRAGVYDPVTERFVYIGGPDGTPVSFYSTDNRTFTAGGAVANTGVWGVRAMATDGAGVIVAVGQNTGSNSRARYSSDGGTTWAAAAFPGAVDSNDLLDVVWHEDSSLFVAVGENAMIFTSPTGAAWTQRTADVAWGTENIGAIATDGTTLIATHKLTGVARTDYLRTTDPTDWSTAAEAFSTANQGGPICWSDESSQFIIIGALADAAAIMRSPDGVTWSFNANAGEDRWVTINAANSESVAIHRNLLFMAIGNGYLSTDYGSTWFSILENPAGVSFLSLVFGRGQLVALSNTGTGSAASERSVLV